jgi:crotonobetainyl-CoA:carnitine CoA-transferase CaiB-like acyl-CoA transferase
VDLPIQMADAQRPPSTPAPRLGEHNRSILAELGLEDEEIVHLEREQVI